MRYRGHVSKGLKRLSNEILPMIFWLLLIFGFDKAYIAILTIISAIIHELGHYSAKLLLLDDADIPIAHLSGLRFRIKKMNSYKQDVVVLACGPLANLLVFILLLPLGFITYLNIFAYLNLATALSNLLPIKGYDGHSILTVLARMRGNDTAVRALDTLSFISSVIITLLSLYLLYRYDTGYWIFGLFIVNLLTEMRKKLAEGVL